MDGVVIVLYIIRAAVPLANCNHLGILHISLGYFLHLQWECGRKEQYPLLLRNTLQNGIQFLLETHVQHLISLIQDKCVHPGKINCFPPDKIQKPSRSGNHNVWNFLERLYLWLDACTAVNIHDAKVVEVFGVVLQVLGDLFAQFAGGAEHQHLCIALHIVGNYTFQRRQAKGRSLSCAGLSQTHYVTLLCK